MGYPLYLRSLHGLARLAPCKNHSLNFRAWHLGPLLIFSTAPFQPGDLSWQTHMHERVSEGRLTVKLRLTVKSHRFVVSPPTSLKQSHVKLWRRKATEPTDLESYSNE